jgi:hypothetical protein
MYAPLHCCWVCSALLHCRAGCCRGSAGRCGEGPAGGGRIINARETLLWRSRWIRPPGSDPTACVWLRETRKEGGGSCERARALPLVAGLARATCAPRTPPLVGAMNVGVSSRWLSPPPPAERRGEHRRQWERPFVRGTAKSGRREGGKAGGVQVEVAVCATAAASGGRELTAASASSMRMGTTEKPQGHAETEDGRRVVRTAKKGHPQRSAEERRGGLLRAPLRPRLRAQVHAENRAAFAFSERVGSSYGAHREGAR